MEIVVTDITTQVEIEAGQELFEVVVTVADSESAERFAIEARESADEAAISAGIATVKASEAVVSASNALTSENEAESAATTATEQAILSAAARDEAVAAKLAAQDSEDNALISALDASLSASDALASENAAELAASTIVDKIDFTGAVEGDLYRVNALGVAEPVSEDKLFRFQNALTSISPSQIQCWDDFQENEGEQNGRVSASGHNWMVIDRLLGDNSGAGYNSIFSVANYQSKNLGAITGKLQVLPINEKNGFFADGVFSWGGGSTVLYFVFFDQTTQNSIYISFNKGYALNQVVGGVLTSLVSVTSDAFPQNSSQSKTGGTFEIMLTKRAFENRYHLGFKVAGFIGGFESGAGDFVSILDNATHFGSGGFRGSSLNAIRVYKMWE